MNTNILTICNYRPTLVVVITLRLLPPYIAGGLLGLFNNCGAYQKWCRTTSARAQFYELTLELCGMIDDPEMPRAGKHRELEPAQIKKSEEAVQRVIIAIKSLTKADCTP